MCSCPHPLCESGELLTEDVKAERGGDPRRLAQTHAELGEITATSAETGGPAVRVKPRVRTEWP